MAEKETKNERLARLEWALVFGDVPPQDDGTVRDEDLEAATRE